MSKIRIFFYYSILVATLIILSIKGHAQKSAKDIWVDSVFNSLSSDEKIGQLFMIRAHSDKTGEYHEMVANQIRNYKVGGICFFQGGPLREAQLTNYYQSISRIPLMVGIDGEWGLGMRLDSVLPYPRPMTLSAISDQRYIYDVAASIARQCKKIGITIDFAPSVDVNINPKNPVINSRSFGEDPSIVSEKSIQYMNGLQDLGVYACAKHFPGHGDTDSDSHKTLPSVNSSIDSIEYIHLLPFKNMIDKGVASVMVGHLFVPALDTSSGRASSLSSLIITDLLKNKMGFKGLIFTDALEMKGVSAYYQSGQLEVMALKAGVDILLMPNDIAKAVDSIKLALSNGFLMQDDIDSKVRKILEYKYESLSITNQWVDTNIVKKLGYAPLDSALNKKLYEKSVTLLKAEKNCFPLNPNSDSAVAFVVIGKTLDNPFFNEIKNRGSFSFFCVDDNADADQIKKMTDTLKYFNTKVINILNTRQSEKNDYNVFPSTFTFLGKIKNLDKLILHYTGNPYLLTKILDSINPSTILINYDNNQNAFIADAAALFGEIQIDGKLPVSINSMYPACSGLQFKNPNVKYPDLQFLKGVQIPEIDSLILSGIINEAYPGARVLVAKSGKVVYNASFGTYEYDESQKVVENSVYDIASVTKIMATSLAFMKLYDEGKIDLNKTLGEYLGFLKGSNKENIRIKDVLYHQAGLIPFIPFYKNTLVNGNLDTHVYHFNYSKEFSIQVAEHIYLRNEYKDSIFKIIRNSELLPDRKYKYSDLGMILMKEIIESVAQKPLDEYLYQNFYLPLGLHYTCFNPSERYSPGLVVPTEMDTEFRKQLLRAYVHDPSAAMLGGISGHAGLFSTADELAIIMQMLIQGGFYNGKQYIKSSTIKEFTQMQKGQTSNRRGLFFDKPLLNHEKGGPCSYMASPESFGHSGFTGTLVWADPTNDLIYIFLSNRVNPNAANNKLSDMSIRTKIHDIIYKKFGN